MRLVSKRLVTLASGALLGFATVAPALADDSEIYLGAIADTSLVRPNVLFVFDTSGSMNTVVAQKEPYDPAVTYPDQGCGSGRIYWRMGTGNPPGCGSGQRFNVAANTCAASFSSLATGAGGGPGTWTGRAAQWNPAGSRLRWENLRSGASADPVECETDAGNHGASAASSAVWARNGSNSARWTTTSSLRINWATRNVYNFYSSNWLNYYYWPGVSSGLTRIQTVKQVLTNLANSIDNVNLGLMRFDSWGEGGMVTHPVENISTNRAAIIASANSYNASGVTPLAETAFEAARYWLGGQVDFGNNTHLETNALYPSVASSRQAGNASRYRSPMEYQCQKNFMVVLTDGEPVSDQSAHNAARIFGLGGGMPGVDSFASVIGNSCTANSPTSPNGDCLDDVVAYLHDADLSGTLPGRQSVTTHTVGFDSLSFAAFLQNTADRGGGRFFPVTNASDLTVALQNIITEVLETNTTFTSPTISVNAFNRAESLDDLYVSVFQPDERLRWHGNLKKYKLQNGVIKDANDNAAVDSGTGFFADGTQSYWSPAPDGGSADEGGAASRLPGWQTRNVYTHFAAAGANLTAAGNLFVTGNGALTDALLGTGAAPTRDELIDWARGRDVGDIDGDGDADEARLDMGDPIHARPAVINYGGTLATPDARDTVIFVPTNDGFLHAVYSKQGHANDGRELWAFIPPEMLPRLAKLMDNPSSATKSYGIDGDVRVLKFDRNQDGIVTPTDGDKVHIYFGLRRGGHHYYALDVTDRNSPRLLWKKSDADWPGLGNAWSTPTITRVNVGSAAQNAEFFVAIVGGGYDEVQENYNHAADTEGHRIFIVDAFSGDVLWRAGNLGSGANLELAGMTNSIPGDITVVDTDGDRFADRMYAADMGGRVFRFDIWNGNGPATLVTGGVIATLGAGDVAGAGIEDTRRFYNAPDVALIKRRGKPPYYNIAIGSGYRGHPLHEATRDRFYSIRDKQPFTKLQQADYDALVPLLDGDLVDVTDDPDNTPVPDAAPGWKFELRLNGGWVGEKVLAESVTLNNVILVPTFEPTEADPNNPCAGAAGRNRLYALRVDSGRAAVDFDENGTLEERWTDLAQSGIASEVAVLIDHGDDDDPTDEDGDGIPDPDNGEAICISGVEVLNRCVPISGTGRTFWERNAQ